MIILLYYQISFITNQFCLGRLCYFVTWNGIALQQQWSIPNSCDGIKFQVLGFYKIQVIHRWVENGEKKEVEKKREVLHFVCFINKEASLWPAIWTMFSTHGFRKKGSFPVQLCFYMRSPLFRCHQKVCIIYLLPSTSKEYWRPIIY